jgi:hypothetical protein
VRTRFGGGNRAPGARCSSMNLRTASLLGMIAMLSAGLAAPSAARTLTVPTAFTPVVAGFIGDETAPVEGTDGRWHVVYELWLTNARPVPATIERVDVLDYDHQERVVATLAGDALKSALHTLSARPAEDASLAPSMSKLVFVELAFATRADVPAAIVHRLTGTGGAGPAATTPAAISYLLAPWDLTQLTPPVLGAPLEGSGWVAVNGCCGNRGAHRGAVLPVDGKLRDAQRFAIDWMRIGADGRFVLGDPDAVTSFLGYDQRVLAVASGTVTEVLDELDDQKPGALPDPSTITVQNVDGNHVILEIAPGTYAFYAHLKRGSVRVEVGDRVVPGQELGRLGNTGNSSAPHLHLHVMSTSSALAGDGLPYVFSRFVLGGSVDAAQWYAPEGGLGTTYRILPTADATGAARRDQLPLDLQIVTFGFDGPSGTPAVEEHER